MGDDAGDRESDLPHPHALSFHSSVSADGKREDLPETNDEVPKRLEFLPSGCVEEMPAAVQRRVVRRRAFQDVFPLIESAVSAPVACFEFRRSQSRRTEYGMPRIVHIPFRMQDALASMRPALEGLLSGFGRILKERGKASVGAAGLGRSDVAPAATARFAR